MNSFRKWLYRPKRTDKSMLAKFYFADEDLNSVAAELDSFDGRKDPERCTILVNQLRVCQDKVLTIIQKMMLEVIPLQRANRDFRVKFPDDVLQESLAGQLWFGAECLAAGSSILNREVESASMRPLARALTKNLDSLRGILREQCLRSCVEYSDRIKEALIIFDKLFAEFELSYVSAMVPVKTMKEYDMLQEVTVLFSETVQRALQICLLTQDMLDDCDPALMFTIPRLAIVSGLLVYPDGPLNPDMEPTSMTEMFRPFQTLLHKIRELLFTLSEVELSMLEKALCSSEEPEMNTQSVASQSDAMLQIDQGFHEEGEGIILPDTIGLLASGESPVTPVNLLPDGLDFGQLSPSSTIVDDIQDQDLTEGLLNKSESQDSGLQSENISTSDTVTIDSPQLVSRDLGASCIVETVPSGAELTPKCTQNTDPVSTVQNSANCDPSENCDNMCSDVNKDIDVEAVNPDDSENACGVDNIESVTICRQIVEDLVNSVISGHDRTEQGTEKEGDEIRTEGRTVDEAGASNSPHVARQFSWQYNVQFALPRINIPDHDVDRHSADSFSSDSTLSDHGNQAGNVSDFVIETLANMNAASSDQTLDNLARSNVAKQNHKAYKAGTRTKAPQRQKRGGSGGASSSSTSHVKDVDLTLPTASQTLHQNQAVKPKPRSIQERRDSVENISCETGAQKDSNNVGGACEGGANHSRTLDNSTSSSSHDTAHNSASSDNKATTNTDKDSGDVCGSEKRSKSVHCDGVSVSSSCSSGPTSSVSCDCESEQNCSCVGSETSSYNSETNDEEEIALAIQAAEKASRNEARARFRSSSDLIHRLFVCIAGVADQLQTNYASDLRHILKCVFEMNVSYAEDEPTTPSSLETTPTNAASTLSNNEDSEVPNTADRQENSQDGGEMNSQTNSQSNSETGGQFDTPLSRRTSGQTSGQSSSREESSDSSTQSRQGSIEVPTEPARVTNERAEIRPQPSTHRQPNSPRRIFDEPPEWVPDDEVERCTACKTPFTFVRRRHHCRNCGKIFCGKCSSTTVPLPQYGHQKPVRVCHRCFLYQVSHFTVSQEF